MMLLMESTRITAEAAGKEQRLYEKRFMAAALKLKLPLLNSLSRLPTTKQIRSFGGLEAEIVRLNEAPEAFECKRCKQAA